MPSKAVSFDSAGLADTWIQCECEVRELQIGPVARKVVSRSVAVSDAALARSSLLR